MVEKDKLWIKFEDHLLNQGVTDLRIKKLRTMFKVVQRGLPNFAKKGRPEIESFVARLHRDEFTRLDGKKYSGSAKSDIKKFLKQFFKWHHGDNELFPKHVSWIRTNIRKNEKPTEKPTLSLKEVRQFANSFSKIEYKLLVLLLFDSGFRISELLSVTKKDLTWDIYDGRKKCFWIACNKSKTLTRRIPVPLFTEEIQSYFNSVGFKELNEDEPLFKLRYSNIVNALKRNSGKVFGLGTSGQLKKKVTPHVLRHSSATYYSRAFDGNMNLIAERYGWSFSSEELKTYIRRSGAYQRAGAKKIFSNELSKIKEKYEEQQQQLEELRKMFMKEVTARKEMQKLFVKLKKN